ncbi:hypothetical protein [Bosea rubneri]|uniref:Uncharacterized protein n=1 Tax=Bosea rubneri TaxID=3075434 RepID=A0ABU3SFF6_9HYPH|nr:hypothetical protein [Bosea sp. ZW T0_25]MDU0343107.1 hypothetical protein [Bosea sp. ZW T0_25]
MARGRTGTTVLALLIGLGLGAGQAFAQAATPAQPSPTPSPPAQPGVGPQTTHPAQVDKGQNMILPSAGQAGQSAAPTMVYDCEKKPQDCTTPASPADQADKPALSPPPAAAPPAKP